MASFRTFRAASETCMMCTFCRDLATLHNSQHLPRQSCVSCFCFHIRVDHGNTVELSQHWTFQTASRAMRTYVIEKVSYRDANYQICVSCNCCNHSTVGQEWKECVRNSSGIVESMGKKVRHPFTFIHFLYSLNRRSEPITDIIGREVGHTPDRRWTQDKQPSTLTVNFRVIN